MPVPPAADPAPATPSTALLALLAEEAAAVEPVAAAAARPQVPGPAPVVFEGRSAQEVIARVHAELGPQARVVAAEQVRTGGYRGFFSRLVYRVTALPPAPAAGAPQAGSPVDVSALFASLAETTTDVLSTVTPTAPATSASFADVLARVAPAAAATASIPASSPAPILSPVTSSHRFGGELPAALRAAGLDGAVLDAALAGVLERGEELPVALAAAFGDLALPSPPRRPGSLIAVVGSPARAHALAAALAETVGVDPAEIACATQAAPAVTDRRPARLRAQSAEEAAERAPGWRRDAVAIVVVESSVTSPGRGWARAVLSALRPTAVWAAADAQHKVEDVTAWTDALGGVDALALDRAATTVSPAAVLGVGVPVARLDGQPATAQRWAALVADAVGARLSTRQA